MQFLTERILRPLSLALTLVLGGMLGLGVEGDDGLKPAQRCRLFMTMGDSHACHQFWACSCWAVLDAYLQSPTPCNGPVKHSAAGNFSPWP